MWFSKQRNCWVVPNDFLLIAINSFSMLFTQNLRVQIYCSVGNFSVCFCQAIPINPINCSAQLCHRCYDFVDLEKRNRDFAQTTRCWLISRSSVALGFFLFFLPSRWRSPLTSGKHFHVKRSRPADMAEQLERTLNSSNDTRFTFTAFSLPWLYSQIHFCHKKLQIHNSYCLFVFLHNALSSKNILWIIINNRPFMYFSFGGRQLLSCFKC